MNSKGKNLTRTLIRPLGSGWGCLILVLVLRISRRSRRCRARPGSPPSWNNAVGGDSEFHFVFHRLLLRFTRRPCRLRGRPLAAGRPCEPSVGIGTRTGNSSFETRRIGRHGRRGRRPRRRRGRSQWTCGGPSQSVGNVRSASF